MPEIVRNLHELASRALPEADYEGARDDIRQLIEIVSHERILTNKKELQIRLFDVLEELEIDEMGNGATNSKGYFQIRLYSKMYKRQLGNRWKTYFDLLSRDEVQGVEGSRIFNSPKIEDFQVSTYLNHIEKHLDLSKQ